MNLVGDLSSSSVFRLFRDSIHSFEAEAMHSAWQLQMIKGVSEQTHSRMDLQNSRPYSPPPLNNIHHYLGG